MIPNFLGSSGNQHGQRRKNSGIQFFAIIYFYFEMNENVN
jgi:hypothetical protein